jgi:A/G-specific adenine glycosylase
MARAVSAPEDRRDPYRTLVAELMLQQTQVSRVLGRYEVFIERFPTVEALAAASEDDVLGLWSGLGYYRRARHLLAAARAVAGEHGGVFPRSAIELRRLPGVGRYTAGAIASIAMGLAEPLVDGNVQRVLARLHGRRGALADPAVVRWAWKRAGELVRAASDPGSLNEGLMELGAVVCTPSSPGCAACPLANLCAARRRGVQHLIPAPKAPASRRRLYCASVLLRDGRGRLAVERRADSGMWAGLWQAPTIERADRAPEADEIAQALGTRAADLNAVESFEHVTTHRLVRFEVWERRGEGRGRLPAGCRWLSRAGISRLGLSNPQRRILLARSLPRATVA